MSTKSGQKFDNNKLRWDLLPVKEVEQLVEILTFGANKYTPYGWQTVPEFNDRYYAALMRHLIEYKKGNKIDTESGKSHLAHALCNVLFLLWKENNVP